MAIQAQPSEAPTASPAPREQSLTDAFHVEIMSDLDSSQSMLLASTDPNQGDLQVVTVDQVAALAAEAHKKIADGVALALDFEAATRQTEAEKPHTWTIADSDSRMPLNITCMSGCNGIHPEEKTGIARATEVTCAQYDTANKVEMEIGYGDERFGGYATLSVEIHSDPVHPDPAKRVPVAAVEVMEDEYIEDLDPDALADVINKFEQRVAAMRIRHTELVRTRAEYFGRQA